MTMSRSVTRIKLQAVDVTSDDIIALTKAFPCLESLTVKDECKESAYHLWCRRNASLIFQHLGMLDNFHTLELDLPREAVAEDITTESGPSKLVSLSALSKLRDLVVPADFFVGFMTEEPACIQRITTLLPDSLCCLTLLLNDQCDWALMEECRTRSSVRRVVGEFLRDEVAPALLIEFPHLGKIDLCYHMGHYHRNKVHTLAARSLPDATSGVEAS